ncbi:MAG: hypothetical protein JKY26_08285 [Pseudomonas sp.]|nr:hypothetical protein [Pseudomonas sp.]
MPTTHCCACGAATSIHRRHIYPLALVAALLDCTLRHYQQSTIKEEHSEQPWSSRANLTDLIAVIATYQNASKQQARELAAMMQRNWLGGFDRLCLSCGIMEMDGV